MTGVQTCALPISWKACPAKDPVEGARLKGLQCASVRVPLDYARPDGGQITLELTRARHTASRSQGAVLLNRGGPGAHGRDLPNVFKSGLPKRVAASYDWIGFDPRGVGASRPSLICDPAYQDPGRARADTIPGDAAEERAWTARAKAYADDCARKYGKVLPHMGTADWARDMDEIRQALGQEKLNYFGYSYGSYLGAVYTQMFPGRTDRVVLDSAGDPDAYWDDVQRSRARPACSPCAASPPTESTANTATIAWTPRSTPIWPPESFPPPTRPAAPGRPRIAG